MIIEDESLLSKEAEADGEPQAPELCNLSLHMPERPEPPPYNYGTFPLPTKDAEKCGPRSVRRRMFQALVFAFTLWLLSLVYCVGMRIAARQKQLRLDAYMTQRGYVRETDGRLERCSRVSDWTSPFAVPPSLAQSHPTITTTAFVVPRTLDSLSFFHRGLLGPGIFEVLADESLDKDSIRITFSALSHHGNRVDENSTVCVLSQGAGRTSLGIFAPNDTMTDADVVSYIITVHVPESPEHLLDIQRLATDLPDFSHSVGDVGGVIHFSTLELSTTNGSIAVESLTATNARLSNVDGPVDGTFDVSSSLEITSEEGDITGRFHLRTRGVRTAHRASLVMSTVSGNITTLITLSCDSVQQTPEYAVSAESTRGALVLELIEAPWPATVQLNGTAPGGYAALALPSSYEGPYRIMSDARPAIYRRSASRTSPGAGGVPAPPPQLSGLGSGHPATQAIEPGRRVNDQDPVLGTERGFQVDGMLYFQPLRDVVHQSFTQLRGAEVVFIT